MLQYLEPAERDPLAASLEFHALVPQDPDPSRREGRLDRRLRIVVPGDREDAERSGQARQRLGAGRDRRAVPPEDVVSRQQDEVGAFAEEHAHGRRHDVGRREGAVVDVAQEPDAQPGEGARQAPDRCRGARQGGAVALVESAVRDEARAGSDSGRGQRTEDVPPRNPHLRIIPVPALAPALRLPRLLPASLPPLYSKQMPTDVYGEFEWRGLVYEGTEGVREALAAGPVTCYIGFDPTASSLHVGSLLPLMALSRLQRFGHAPIAIAGGGTGMIGDPSGKTQERQLLGLEQIEENLRGIRPQLERFLDFDAPPRTPLAS